MFLRIAVDVHLSLAGCIIALDLDIHTRGLNIDNRLFGLAADDRWGSQQKQHDEQLDRSRPHGCPPQPIWSIQRVILKEVARWRVNFDIHSPCATEIPFMRIVCRTEGLQITLESATP